MKKEYLTPDVAINRILLEENFVATGENLSESSYGGAENTFWE